MTSYDVDETTFRFFTCYLLKRNGSRGGGHHSSGNAMVQYLVCWSRILILYYPYFCLMQYREIRPISESVSVKAEKISDHIKTKT